MKIYPVEQKLGLEAAIKANTSVAYCMPSLSTKEPNKDIILTEDLSELISQASSQDDDVHKVYSILVSTSWNKNDDVFTREEVWASKDTPLYKPTNLEHNEEAIVGNIIGNWPVDSDYKSLVDTNLTDAPDFFHILVASVIYKQWQDPNLKSRADELIQQVEAGDMYVSMECLFKGFDYAVRTPDNERHIISRGEQTAFLTKHLRAYGGNGEYQGHRVGRLLRNITFSGKGFVAKPANPDSVIFNRDTNFDFTNASLAQDLFLTSTEPVTEINHMSDYLEGQVKDLQEALSSVEAENRELTEKLSQANVEKFEATLAEMQEAQEETTAALSAAQEELSKAQAEIEGLNEQLNAKSTELEKVQTEIGDMKEVAKIQKRTDVLVQAGLDAEDAAAKSESFANLSDEQFTSIADAIVSMQDKKSQEETEASSEEEVEVIEDQDEEAEASKVDEEVLETASEVEAVDLSVAADTNTDQLEPVRASLQDWVNKRVLNKMGE